MANVKQEILTKFLAALEEMAETGRVELAEQGHKATGKGIRSIEPKAFFRGLNTLVGIIEANDYLMILDAGVPASRIPFSRPGGRGGTSAYIEGLIRWARVVKPGLSLRERRSFAFAVAQNQKKFGMPTPSSFRFSRNGRRTGWIKNSFLKADNERRLIEALQVAEILSDSFEEALKSVNVPVQG